MYRISPYPSPKRPRFEPWKKNYSWTLTWCCVTVLVKYWHWRSYLDIGLVNWLKLLFWLQSTLVVGSYGKKEAILGWLWLQGFIGFLVVYWACKRFVTVRGDAHGKDFGLEFYGGMCLEVWQGKRWRLC